MNRLDHQHVGAHAGTTDQYLNFKKLRDQASSEELLALLKHKNSVVKGYASWGLADKKYPKLYEVLAGFLEKEETVVKFEGCIISGCDLASEFYQRVFYDDFQYKKPKEDSLFFREQIRQMDSVILYKHEKNYLLIYALDNNDADPRTYERIKQISSKNKRSEALVALAEYRNPSDIPFILDQKESSFLAIAAFPDIAFWDPLLRYKAENRSLDYLLALASYKNERSLEALKDIYQTCDIKQLALLDEALIKNYCLLYEDLILNIWTEHKTIDLSITQSLLKNSPERSARAFANGLLSDKDFNFLELDQDYGSSRKILPLMLRSVQNCCKDMIPDICKTNVRLVKLTWLESFLDFIEENKVTETTDILVKKLQEQDNAFEIFHITKALLSFRNKETTKTVSAFLKEHTEYWDRGNWSEHYHKLMKEYGINL